MLHQAYAKKASSRESIDSLHKIQDLLHQVQENSKQSVAILLDTATQLQLLEDLFLGKDSVT